MASAQTQTSRPDPNERRWAIISLASIPLIMTLGNSMLIPILPLMEEELEITKVQSSYMITMYSIVAIFLIPIAGYLSDRFGRKKVIIPALIITGIGGLIAGWVSWKMENPYSLILVGRVLQGIGASGAMPIVLPLVGDMFQRDEDASNTLGIIETSNTIGKVLSPILGAVLAAMVWFLPFFSIPVFCVISVLLISFFVKKHKKETVEKPITFSIYWDETKKAFKEHGRWMVAIFIIGAILMFILFGFLFYLSNILEDKYHYTGVWKGVLLAIPLLALALASYITGKKIKDDLQVMKWVTFSGICMTGFSVVFIGLFTSPVYLLALFLLCGSGIVMALPCLDALITKNFKKTVRGIVSSIYSAMRFIGVAAGPPLIAILMTHPIYWMIGLFILLSLGASFLSFKYIKP